MGLNRALMTEAVGLMEAGAAAAEEMVDMVEEETRGTKPSLHPILLTILRCINHLRAIRLDFSDNVESGPAQSQRKVADMNIYVGNLSLDVTEEELRRQFMTFGQVLSVTIMNDKYIGSGQP